MTCRECPSKGVTCERTGTRLERVDIDAGYFRISAQSYESTEIRKCPWGLTACKGGTNFSDGGNGYCHEGYEGPYCGVCSPNYYKSTTLDVCSPCTDATIGLPFLGFIAILALIGIYLVIRKMAPEKLTALAESFLRTSVEEGAEALEEQAEDAVAEILEGGTRRALRGAADRSAEEEEFPEDESAGNNKKAAQVDQGGCGSAGSATEHPDEGGAFDRGSEKKSLYAKLKPKAKIMIAFAQLVSSMGFTLGVSFPSAYTKFLSVFDLANLNPFQLVPIDCMYPTNYYWRMAVTTITPLVVGGILLTLHFSCNNSSNLAEAEAKHQRRFFSLFLLLSYLILPTCSSAILRMFKCDEFEDVGTSFMVADYSLICQIDGETQTERKGWMVFAAAMLLIYPFGIPLMYAVLLWKEHEQLCPRLSLLWKTAAARHLSTKKLLFLTSF